MRLAPRLSLVQQIVLLLVAAVLIAVTALGGVVAWNLRSGFNDYLRFEDQVWLERFAEAAGEAVERQGLMAALGGPRGSLNALVLAAGPGDVRGPDRRPGGPPGRPPQGPADEPTDEPQDGPAFGTPPGSLRGPPAGPPGIPPRGLPRNHREPPPLAALPPRDGGSHRPDHPPPRDGRRAPLGAPVDAPVDERWDPALHPPGDPQLGPRVGPRVDAGPGPGPSRLHPAAQHFARRLSLVSLDGQPLGDAPLDAAESLLTQDILANGRPVAVARLRPRIAAPQSLDASFLARQYRAILLTGLALVAVAAASAVWVGRRWLRPIQEVRLAAHSLAQGDLETRLQPRGHDELTDLAHDINAMAGSLQQLEASRRRWIAELSHEMRTPLAVLRGEVECLIDGLRPLNAAALESLQAEVARITRLVEDFHQLALSDLRALPCSFAALDPADLLAQAVSRFKSRAAAAGLALGYTAPAVVPQARWDAQRIGQLLDNLLENSVRYTHAPGRIRLSLEVAGGSMLRLVVDDSAPGVPPGSEARLFEPLYRVDASRSRASGGSGLGLAIAQAIVRSHGGRISAVPSALGGLCVEVNLPLQPEAVA